MYVCNTMYAHWPRGAVKATVALQFSDQNAISLQVHEQVVKWSGGLTCDLLIGKSTIPK